MVTVGCVVRSVLRNGVHGWFLVSSSGASVVTTDGDSWYGGQNNPALVTRLAKEFTVTSRISPTTLRNSPMAVA